MRQRIRHQWKKETWEEYQEGAISEVARREQARGGPGWASKTQQDREQYGEFYTRIEDDWFASTAPLCREMDAYFDHLHLPPLPPPLPRSSPWLDITQPCYYEPQEIRPFYLACQEGQLDEVRRWAADKRDDLRPVGLQDGLCCAAKGNQADVARFLLDQGLAHVDSKAVQFACQSKSLPLFQVFLQHGYHPDQQVPVESGIFGTALAHCLESEQVTRLLLEHGADATMARFALNGRYWSWRGIRAAPPMDRTSGLPLDLAVEKHSLETVKLLLEHGAKHEYSRPFVGVVLHRLADGEGSEDEWRPLMEVLLRYGVDINGRNHSDGAALAVATRKQRWDVVEFLLRHGADPRLKTPSSKKDAFADAADTAGIPWEDSEGLQQYLSYLCDFNPGLHVKPVSAPDGVRQNPLVGMLLKVRGMGEEDQGVVQAQS